MFLQPPGPFQTRTLKIKPQGKHKKQNSNIRTIRKNNGYFNDNVKCLLNPFKGPQNILLRTFLVFPSCFLMCSQFVRCFLYQFLLVVHSLFLVFLSFVVVVSQIFLVFPSASVYSSFVHNKTHSSPSSLSTAIQTAGLTEILKFLRKD